MKRVTLSTALLAGLAGALACAVAQAEILGWVDAAGNVTYSNLPPPRDARVIDQIAEIPVDPEAQARARAAAAALHESQLQALDNRVRDLEQQLKQSRAASPVMYPVAPPPATGTACDSQLYDCGAWDGPIYYAIGLPFARPPHRHPEGRPRGPRHFAQNMAASPPRSSRAGPRR